MRGLAYNSAVVVAVLPAASAALAGVTVRLSTDNKPYWCNGSAWVDLTAGGVGYSLTANTALPATSVAFLASHGLGVVPAFAVLELICLVADQGFSVGDVVQPVGYYNGAAAGAYPLWKSATQVGVIPAPGFATYILNKSNGATVFPTAASWNYRFRLGA